MSEPFVKDQAHRERIEKGEAILPSYPGSAELLALAVDYETGLQRMVASGYEEFSPDVKRNHQMVIDALRFRARAVAQGWRDISTAPKDDRRVLIAGRYSNGAQYVEESYRHHAGHYNARKIEPPTHWMPLPESPAVSSTLRQCPICARRVASPCETLAIATSCPLSSTNHSGGA